MWWIVKLCCGVSHGLCVRSFVGAMLCCTRSWIVLALVVLVVVFVDDDGVGCCTVWLSDLLVGDFDVCGIVSCVWIFLLVYMWWVLFVLKCWCCVL